MLCLTSIVYSQFIDTIIVSILNSCLAMLVLNENMKKNLFFYIYAFN